jgi:hypothetical protein
MELNRRWIPGLTGILVGCTAWYALAQREASVAGPGIATGGNPLALVASTTTSTTTGVGVIVNDSGDLAGFYPTDPAVLIANADIDADGVNDIITVVVQPPLPPPFPAPSSYAINVTSGATGLTIDNYTAVSPLWW